MKSVFAISLVWKQKMWSSFTYCTMQLSQLLIYTRRTEYLKWMIQSNLVDTDTEGDIESVRVNRVEFRENVGAFFLQGQNKLSVIMMSLY